MPETNTFDLGWNFPCSIYSGETEHIPLFSSHQSITLPMYRKHRPSYVLALIILCIKIFIYDYELGLTNARGRHRLHIARLSAEDCFIYLMGKMRVEGIALARCGAFTTIRDRSWVG